MANGGDLKIVQARLGHANASLTLKVYDHALPARDEAAANLVASLYSAPSEPILIVATSAGRRTHPSGNPSTGRLPFGMFVFVHIAHEW